MKKQYLCFIVLIFFVGCASTSNIYIPITNTDQRIVLDDLSFLPPEGQNWEILGKPVERQNYLNVGTGNISMHYLNRKPRASVNYGNWGRESIKIMEFKKKIVGQNQPSEEAEELWARVIKRKFAIMSFDNNEDLMDFAAGDQRKKVLDRLGYGVLESNASFEKFNGMNCVKTNSKLEGGRKTSGDTATWVRPSGIAIIIYTQEYTCVHPSSPYHVISIGGEQQVLKGKSPTDIQNELDPFFNSLKVH